MSWAEVYFGLEDLLCIYQKDKQYKEFLICGLTTESFGSRFL